VNKAMNN